jgi:Iap family predicted aminopeptidase
MNTNVINFLLKEFKINTFSELFETMFRLIDKKIPKMKRIIGNCRSEYAVIDNTDDKRLDKYLRISEADYLRIKRWHSLYNEFGMASTVRDIIMFFYNGVVQYGLEEFLKIVGKKLKLDKLKNDFLDKMTQLLNINARKQLLYALVIENYPKYVYST